MEHNLPPLPAPALTQHPSGNVYFSPQQMHAYALEAISAHEASKQEQPA